MRSDQHWMHISSRVSHNDCDECRADTERRFVSLRPWRYQHTGEYLAYVRPRLAAMRNGADTVEARVWRRKFERALHRRISGKVPVAGRKRCDSYLERMGQFRRDTDAGYLRRFAARGASCLGGGR